VIEKAAGSRRQCCVRFEKGAVHAHVGAVPPPEELGVIAVEHASEGGCDGGRPGHARIAMNDDALDLGPVLKNEVPNPRGVLS